MYATKDPQAVSDYSIDFTDWLGRGDSLTSASWAADSDHITLANESLTGNVAAVRVSGGVAGYQYRLACTFTTEQGITDIEVIRLTMADR